MSYLTAQKNLISQDLKQLISYISGVEEDSINFSTIENNAWSIIMHYNAPSIDKCSIKAKISGFVEKLKIHAYSFPQKAKNLQLLVDRYLEINFYEEDVQWGLLQLLFLLSKRPTEAKYDDKPIVFPLYQPAPEEETFNWGNYLKEGLPEYKLPLSDDDSFSDIEESGFNKEISQTNQFIKVKKILSNISESTSYTLNLADHSSNTYYDQLSSSRHTSGLSRTLDESKSEREREQANLKSALIAKEAYRRTNPTWWAEPLHRETPQSSMPIANACFLWEKSKLTRGAITEETRILSEFKAIKQLISALYRPHECYILKKCGVVYKPREKVSISSTNPIDFYNALLEISPYLSMIEQLNNFIKLIDDTAVCIDSCSIAPNTYVAYAGALKDVLSNYCNFLSTIEASVNQQDGIYLVSYLMIEVRPWLSHLKEIYNVHLRAIDKDWESQENWICSVRLLAVLFDSLQYRNGWEKAGFTVIFLKTFRAYITILETWLLYFKYEDPNDEFLLLRPSRNVCEGNIIVRDYQSYLSSINIPKSLIIDNFVYYSIRACSSVDFKTILNEDSFEEEPIPDNYSPFFLEYISSFFNEIQRLSNADLTHTFMSSVSKKADNPYRKNDSDELREEYDNEERKLNCSPVGCNRLSFDDMLKSVFSSILKPTDYSWLYSRSNDCKSSCILDKIESRDLDSEDITRLLKNHFTEVITERMQPKGFANSLLKDYKLLEHVNVIKSIYLFLNGVTMNNFSKSLFSKVLINNLKAISWTNELRELIYKDYPMYYMNFNVTMSYGKLNFEEVLNIPGSSYPDFIEFSHEVNISYWLEPPLNLVITSESIERYNSLFHLLLQTKWAASCLSNLSFKDLSRSLQDSLNSRLISLRLFLFHNVSTFERYFISINSEDFDQDIVQVCSVARDIHVIANAHEKILNQRRMQCFLVGAPKILECILNILRFCQIFSSLWKLSSQKIESLKVTNELTNFELKYKECIDDLANNLLHIGKDQIFKNNINFSYFCDELFNNMPGDWE